MTIGALSRRTGVSVKTLRQYEDLGLIYTAGRSAGNYRLFNDEALWCIGVISMLRNLGLTLAEIQELATNYLQRTSEPSGPRLAKLLAAVRDRTEQRIDTLHQILQRIGAFEAGHAAELTGDADFRAQDPHFGRQGT